MRIKKFEMTFHMGGMLEQGGGIYIATPFNYHYLESSIYNRETEIRTPFRQWIISYWSIRWYGKPYDEEKV